MSEGRQDINAPEPTLERSDPTPVDVKRGTRMVLGVSLVGLVFVVVIIVILLTR